MSKNRILQEKASNHLELLCSKDRVVSIHGKCCKSSQIRN